MKIKLLVFFASLTVLAGGCASGPSYDNYLRELDPPYWESTRLNAPAHLDNAQPLAGKVALYGGLQPGSDTSAVQIP